MKYKCTEVTRNKIKRAFLELTNIKPANKIFVKEIIQAHGENINCISTEGVGTEFIFTLPLAKEQKEHA